MLPVRHHPPAHPSSLTSKHASAPLPFLATRGLATFFLSAMPIHVTAPATTRPLPPASATDVLLPDDPARSLVHYPRPPLPDRPTQTNLVLRRGRCPPSPYRPTQINIVLRSKLLLVHLIHRVAVSLNFSIAIAQRIVRVGVGEILQAYKRMAWMEGPMLDGSVVLSWKEGSVMGGSLLDGRVGSMV